MSRGHRIKLDDSYSLSSHFLSCHPMRLAMAVLSLISGLIQRLPKFSQIIAVICLITILTPIIILFAVEIPESVRSDWQPWAN